MANHRDLPDGELHEPKGVAGATAGTTYIANGAGSGTWTNPQVSSIVPSAPELTALGPNLQAILIAMLNRIEALEDASTSP